MQQRQMKESLVCLVFLALFTFSNGFAPARKFAPIQESYALGKSMVHSIRIMQPQFRSSLPALMMSEKPIDNEKQGQFTLSQIQKRWLTGLTLGAVATLWIFSGNGYFTLGFFLTAVISQIEYYHMVENTGVQPAKKIGIISSGLCYIVASKLPMYHELVMPLATVLLMIWLLIFKKKSSSINEISSTFLGMFYLGYIPSFWVRLRALGEMRNTLFPIILQKWGWTQVDTWTHGAIVTWWTWCSIVFADVGAYFVGKRFGKTKLSALSEAAGSASPRKTVEGAIGGFTACMSLSILGAYLMQWPYWFVSGAVYGLLMGVLGLVGDLTASMMKRDAGVKDSGYILPGHGGLLDRIDSYMLTAPASYFFCIVILPLLQSTHQNIPLPKLGFPSFVK